MASEPVLLGKTFCVLLVPPAKRLSLPIGAVGGETGNGAPSSEGRGCDESPNAGPEVEAAARRLLEARCEEAGKLEEGGSLEEAGNLEEGGRVVEVGTLEAGRLEEEEEEEEAGISEGLGGTEALEETGMLQFG